MTKYLYIIGLTLSSFNASFLFGGQKYTKKGRRRQEQMRTELKKEFKIRRHQIKKMGKKMRMKSVGRQENRSLNGRIYRNFMENNSIEESHNIEVSYMEKMKSDVENIKADIERVKENVRKLVIVVRKLIYAVNECGCMINKHTGSIAKIRLNIKKLFQWVAGIFSNCQTVENNTIENNKHSVVAST